MAGKAPYVQTEVDGQLGRRTPARLPFVVYVLALATFLMLTTEFVVTAFSRWSPLTLGSVLPAPDS